MVAPGETLEGNIPVPSTYPNPLSNNVNMQPMGWTRGEGERWAQNTVVGQAPTPGGGGGGDTPEPPSGGFVDDFTRSDRVLAGDNGWFKSDSGNTADLHIVGNKVVVPNGVTTLFGSAPMVHPRVDGDPNVADVTVTLGRSDNTGNTGIVVASDDTFQFAVGFEIDGSGQYVNLDIITDGAGGPSAFDNDHNVLSDFLGGTATFRCTYNNTTKVFSVYQDGVLALDVNVQAALDDYFGAGVVTFPDLSALPNAGLISNAGAGIESFDEFTTA